MFTDLAVSLQESSTEDELANTFLLKFVCLPGVTAAAIYLRAKSKNSFVLAANSGFPENSLPCIKKVETDSNDETGGLTSSPSWSLGDKYKEGLNSLGIKLITTAKLRSKDAVNGLLIVGWSSTGAIFPEIEEAISAVCTFIGTVIDGSRLYSDLERSHMDSIVIINKLVAVVDKFGKGHSTRVAQISEEIAAELGLKQEQLSLVYEAGIVHDIGRICIPPEILNKPGKLTEEEYEIVKEHPLVGVELISPLSIYKKLVPGVLYHHERLDGSGYPEGLTDSQIPLFARIIAVADVYDAMTCDRAYRPALGSDNAIAALKDGSGKKYDRDIVEALIRVMDRSKKAAS
jgi:HD-GYP domain-containing protein (c-di-GMP phosphodiesterase class II)